MCPTPEKALNVDDDDEVVDEARSRSNSFAFFVLGCKVTVDERPPLIRKPPFPLDFEPPLDFAPMVFMVPRLELDREAELMDGCGFQKGKPTTQHLGSFMPTQI